MPCQFDRALAAFGDGIEFEVKVQQLVVTGGATDVLKCVYTGMSHSRMLLQQ